MKTGSGAKKLLQSGIIFSAINFLTGLGNLGFQIVMGHLLNKPGQYSNANSALNAYMPLLGLPPQLAIMAVTHYIAHYHSIGDTPRLQGLFAGCRKFMLHLTIFGSLLAIVVAKPLSEFFNYTSSVMLVSLICSLLGLWTSLATALCQGLSWFKRLAAIGFLVMVLRVSFSYISATHWPRPEAFVISSTLALLAYLTLLYWRKDFTLPRDTVATSPWNHEFILYLTVSAAFVVGNYCFSSSDLLVMQKYFQDTNSGDAYTAAERLAFSLPTTVAPLLTVLFTNRSIAHSKDALREQMKLISLFAGGLLFGAVCLFIMRHFCLRLLHKDSAEAGEMIQYLSVTMIFVGLLQAIGTWALASRWSKISLLYGALGLGYTTLILTTGRTPETLLHTMPVAAGVSFLVLFAVWVFAMRRHKPVT